MKVKITDLELNEIRRVMPINVNGEEKEIKILNLMGQDRLEMLSKFREISQLEDNKEVARELFVDVYKKCTDIEMDGDFIEILNNPTVELMQVQMEIQEIIHEIQCEEMISRISEMNQLESMTYAQLALKKSERIESMMSKIKDLEKEHI